MPAGGYTQTAYLFRADNGGETGCVAAQLAPLNTSPTGLSRNANYRVRFGFNNSGSATSITTKLQVNRNGGGWVDASATAPVKTISSAYVADGAATTQQITSGSYFAGEVEASDNNTLGTLFNFGSSASSEVEFCFQINSAYANVGDTIQLRLANMGTYSQTPSISLTAVLSLIKFPRVRNLRYGSRSPQ
jgi:hypothetical protein